MDNASIMIGNRDVTEERSSFKSAFEKCAITSAELAAAASTASTAVVRGVFSKVIKQLADAQEKIVKDACESQEPREYKIAKLEKAYETNGELIITRDTEIEDDSEKHISTEIQKTRSWPTITQDTNGDITSIGYKEPEDNEEPEAKIKPPLEYKVTDVTIDTESSIASVYCYFKYGNKIMHHKVISGVLGDNGKTLVLPDAHYIFEQSVIDKLFKDTSIRFVETQSEYWDELCNSYSEEPEDNKEE